MGSADRILRTGTQLGGLVLVSAGVLKSIEPFVLQQWIHFAIEVSNSWAWSLALAVVVFEVGVGLASILRPRAFTPVIASTFGAFCLLHVMMSFDPSIGRCPCLGVAANSLSETAQSIVLGVGSALISVTLAGAFLWNSLSGLTGMTTFKEPRPQGAPG